MVVHNSIPGAILSRPRAFSPIRSAFFAIRSASIPGNIPWFSPFSPIVNLFLSARFLPIPINSRQKAAYLARFA